MKIEVREKYKLYSGSLVTVAWRADRQDGSKYWHLRGPGGSSVSVHVERFDGQWRLNGGCISERRLLLPQAFDTPEEAALHLEMLEMSGADFYELREGRA